MRVLFLAEDLDLPELHLLRGLADSGIWVEAMLSPSATAFEKLLSTNIETSPLKLRSRIDIKGILKIRKKLQEKKYDIMHMLLNRQLSNGLLASTGLSIKTVGYRGTMGHVERWNPGSWLTYKNPRLNRISCVSNAVRDYLLSAGIPERKLVTIYKGHDLSWYPEEKMDLKKTFNFPKDSFLVGCTAAMRKVKGIDYLIKSAHNLPENTSIRFLLIGEVRDKALLELAGHPAIAHLFHFAGYRTDAAALISNCDVFVMPSIEREGFPKALLEGMVQGVPAVVTSVGGMPEVVENQQSGLIVPPRNSKALAEALIYLETHRDTVSEFGRKARQRIAESFNIKLTIVQTQKLYESVISAPD